MSASRLRLRLAVVLVVLVAIPVGMASADGGTPNQTGPTTVAEGPVITAVVTGPGSEDPGTPPRSVPIPCGWDPFLATDEDADNYNDITAQIVGIINSVVDTNLVISITYYSEDGHLHRWNDVRGRFEAHQIADCARATDPGGVTSGDGRWIAAVPPDPAILLPGATREASKPIKPPAPTLSPADRSAVNLGMWLAVQSAGPVSVRAVLGPVWAETTATMVSTSFDPGNGDDPVVCAGHGTPIPESEKSSIEEGPCGYTYTADTNGEPLDFTITSTWTITWELSDGRTGSEPDILVTTVLPYEVYEIQTVGTDG
mgnify:CR=1 FL=1